MKTNRKAQVARKLKMLRKAAACATLFAGLLSGLAHGQTIITGDPDTGAVNKVGSGGWVIVENLNGLSLNVNGNTADPASGYSPVGYTLTQGMDVSNSSITTGFQVNSTTQTGTGKTYSWIGDYNVTKSTPVGPPTSYSVTGFEFVSSGNATFEGTILGDDMNITNQISGITRGFSFHKTNDPYTRGNFNGTLTVGNVTVDGYADTATGLYTGNLGGNTDISFKSLNVDSSAYSSDAYGVNVSNIAAGATLVFGNDTQTGGITVTSSRDAYGFKAGEVNAATITIDGIDVDAGDDALGMSLDGITDAAVIDVKSIQVYGDDDATGFQSGDIGNGAALTFGDINVSGDDYVTGFSTGDIGRNVTIEIDSASAYSYDGYADGVVLGDIGNGATLTMGEISAEAYGDYGDGTAFRAGEIGGNVTIEIDSASAFSWDGYADGVVLGDIKNGAEITIGSIEVDGEYGGLGMSVGDIENNVVIGITSINVEGDYGDGMGFTAENIGAAQITIESINVYGDDDATGMSVGDITGPATIKVDSINVGADDDGTGFQAGNIQNGATLTFETIDASGDDYAIGFEANLIGAASITIKSVTSNANDFALGVGINEIGDGARIKIDNIQADGIHGDSIGFQANSVNQSTLTFGGFTAVADDDAVGIKIGSLNSGATVNITGVGNATTFSYDGSGIATGVSIGSITGATINAKESTIYANVKDSDWGTGSGEATAVSVGGNINSSTLTFGMLDAVVDNVGTAIGFSTMDVDASNITVDSINAQTLDATGMFANANDATGMRLQNVTGGSDLNIGAISAEAVLYGNAVGFEAALLDNSHVTLDDVSVATDIGNATGVLIDGNVQNGAVLTVNNGITAMTTTSSNTVGLTAQDVDAGQILAHNAAIVAINYADGTDNSTGSATGVMLRDVLNGSVIDLGNVGASVVDSWETPTAGEGDAIGFQARDIAGSRVSIAHAGAMSFDGDATGVDLRDIGAAAALTFGHIGAAAMNTGDAVGLSARNVDAATVGLGEIDALSVGGDAYGVRITNQAGSDASLVTTGDITATTQKADGTGTAYGLFAKSFGSNGLVVDHTISAVADVQEDNAAFSVYAADGNNKVTIEKNAVLDASNTVTEEQGLALRFGANTQADSKNLVVFDTKGAWNNGGKIFHTDGVSDFTFEDGTVATISGTQNMTTGKDGVRTVASTATVKSGASVILDGSGETASIFNMAAAGNNAGTFHIEEGGSIDAFSKADENSAAINGNLMLDGTMTLRFEGDENVGLYVGSNGGEKGGVITVGDTAKIDVVLDGSFEGMLEVAETAWEDFEGNRDQIALDYISDKISTNTFYNLKAINDEGGYLGYRGRDYVLMPEMFVLASQFHNYRSIYDATANRFALARTEYAGIGPCDQSCSSLDCDHPMKKSTFGRNAWVNWIGRGNDQLRSRVTGGNMDFSSNGVQVGLDVYKTNRFLVGMMYGYEDGKLNAKDGYGSHMKGEDNYFGFYGQAIFQNGFDISGTIGYGRQDFDLVRSNRYGTHKASFDADSVEATLELGYMFKLRKNLTFRPVLAMDIYNSDVDGATEAGDWDRSRYNDYSLTQAFLRFGADVRLTRKWFSVDTGVYYSYQMHSGAKTVSAGVTSVNQLITRPMEYKLGDSVLTVNVGGNVFLNKARTLSLFGGYHVDFHTDRINDQALHNGRIGISYKF